MTDCDRFQEWGGINHKKDVYYIVYKLERGTPTGDGGYSPKNWAGVCHWTIKTLTLYLRPQNANFATLFQTTCLKKDILFQTIFNDFFANPKD